VTKNSEQYLSPEAVQKFQQIVQEENNITLTEEEAHRDAIAFIEAFKILATDTGLIQKQLIDTEEKECD
jgi:hypothetical protein